MRFMTLIKHHGDYDPTQVPPALYEAMGPFVQEQMERGAMIDGAGLQPLKFGKQVHLKAGKVVVVDGPFAEAKEVVGGYAIFELASYEEALELTVRFMELHRAHWPGFEGISELRPLEAMG